ncbi:MAG: hypothetical protein IJ527_01740 [Prevotella sp.]|nr:hypothetical protein [Prevotella sp.]
MTRIPATANILNSVMIFASITQSLAFPTANVGIIFVTTKDLGQFFCVRHAESTEIADASTEIFINDHGLRGLNELLKQRTTTDGHGLFIDDHGLRGLNEFHKSSGQARTGTEGKKSVFVRGCPWQETRPWLSVARNVAGAQEDFSAFWSCRS